MPGVGFIQSDNKKSCLISFTLGDEPYKKYFAKEQGILLEYTRPLSLKALPRHGWMKLKAFQRRSSFIRLLKEWGRGKVA